MFLSPHFSLAELTVTEVRRLQAKNRTEARAHREALQALANLLEQVRVILGDRPIIVNSGFRCVELNTVIGGSPSSQHTRGEAADIRISGMDLRQAFNKLRRSKLQFGQLIAEDGNGDGEIDWLHISLGAPWRDLERCGQVLEYDGTTYKKL
jgi:zinc D-Ala-D-Ala carboxypeptidase